MENVTTIHKASGAVLTFGFKTGDAGDVVFFVDNPDGPTGPWARVYREFSNGATVTDLDWLPILNECVLSGAPVTIRKGGYLSLSW